MGFTEMFSTESVSVDMTAGTSACVYCTCVVCTLCMRQLQL